MAVAKELAHPLLEQRQTIKRSIIHGYRPTKEQSRKIDELNKQMREIFRKATSDE